MNAITSSGRKTSQTVRRVPAFCFAAPKNAAGEVIIHSRQELIEIIRGKWVACGEEVDVGAKNGEIVSDTINGLPRRRSV